MRARRGLCGAARPRRVVKEPQFMNSEFTTQLWCLDALLSRGPGARFPRQIGRARLRSHGARHIATWTHARCDMGALCPLRPRQAAPPPDPSGSRPPRAPWSQPTGDRPATPRPAAIISRRSSDGVRRRPRQLVTRARHGHGPRETGSPARQSAPDRDRDTLGIIFRAPGPAPLFPTRDARATITHSGHTFTLDSALKPLSHPPETLIHSHSTHPLCLSYSLTRIHSLSLTFTQTHPLTHSHASTHSHSLKVRVDAHLTGSR